MAEVGYFHYFIVFIFIWPWDVETPATQMETDANQPEDANTDYSR